ncbi:hypothetical protein AAFN88_11045 [Pelagibius sp. CAU 1746]|uniref:hypothetical protein n=1 Tax=Pelagibius sp. CAU 1746 TaxID=3140370 RepID=UPI00325AEFE6
MTRLFLLPRLEVEIPMILHKLIPVAAGATLVLALAGCDESEQGRVLRYEKGTYLGKADSELSEERRDELRSRATLQSGG